MINSEITNLSNSKNWIKNLFKLEANLKDIYFAPEYYHLYEELGTGKANCFIFQENDKIALYPFLLNSVNELNYDLDQEYFDIEGAYGYNGIISNDNSLEFRKNFYTAFNEYCKNNNIIAEFTRFHPLINNYKFSESFMTIIKDRTTVSIDLTKKHDTIWANCYSSRNRNMIRKAHKNQFTIHIHEDPSNKKIESFFEIYQNAMKTIKADDYYLFNEKFFLNTFKYLKSGAVLFEVLNPEKKVECAAIVMVFGQFSHYHLSGRKSNSDNSVNNFILDEAIKYAINKGAKYFHLGGGTTSNENDPLLKFKSNFSKEKGDFYIGKKIHNQEVYDQVIAQWSIKCPNKSEKYSTILLKYRY